MLDPAKNPPSRFPDPLQQRWKTKSSFKNPTSSSRCSDNFRILNASETRSQERTVPGDESDSGVCSPPLWPTSPDRSTQYYRTHYRSLSPESRAKAVASGQRELMEMVSHMPDSCYELTLKDLVENPKALGRETSDEEEILKREALNRRKVSNKKSEVKEAGRRIENVDRGGFYLNVTFPLFLSSCEKKKKKKKTKKKNNDFGVYVSGKVSPKLPFPDGSAKLADPKGGGSCSKGINRRLNCWLWWSCLGSRISE